MMQSKRCGFALVPILAGAIGCTSEVSGPLADSGSPAEQQITAAEKRPEVPPETPEPVAKTTLDNGNTLEIYDYGYGALVTETGQAYVTPMLKPSRGPGADVIEVWQSVTGKAPPAELLELRERLADVPEHLVPPQGEEERAARTARAGGELLRGTRLMAPVGCDNGCCDYEWLSSLDWCQGDGTDYDWILFNYGASWFYPDEISYYAGLVCAATGNSQFDAHLSSGAGGSWSIAQGYYKTYEWIAGWSLWTCAGWCGKDLDSWVNSVSNQRLHTYCGSINYE
jgi:hypothetical protein